MVERLKAAIEKARQQQAGDRAGTDAGRSAATPDRRIANDPASMRQSLSIDDSTFGRIPRLPLDGTALGARRVVTADRSDPAYIAFDVLRTRLLKVCRDRGWRRIAITSPTKGCGKSVVCANLAISVARHADSRPMLIDFDMRFPSLARLFDLQCSRDITRFLDGIVPVEDYLVCLGDSLILLANTTQISQSAERISSRRTAEMIGQLQSSLNPTIMIFDMAPLLVSDDVLGFLPQVDAVLLVAAAGETTPREIADCERLMGDVPFLGVVLNKDEVDMPEVYLEQYA